MKKIAAFINKIAKQPLIFKLKVCVRILLYTVFVCLSLIFILFAVYFFSPDHVQLKFNRINAFSQVESYFLEKFKEKEVIQTVEQLQLPNTAIPEQAIPIHWVGEKGDFVLVAKSTPARVSHDDLSTVREILPLLMRVRILYVSDPTFDSGDDPMAFVASADGTVLFGWVLLADLAFPKSFKTVYTLPNISLFSIKKGDYIAEYQLVKNGFFSGKWSATGQGLFLTKEITGRVYKYKNLIWMKRVNEDVWHDFFYIDDLGGLQHEARYQGQPIDILK